MLFRAGVFKSQKTYLKNVILWILFVYYYSVSYFNLGDNHALQTFDTSHNFGALGYVNLNNLCSNLSFSF